MNSPLQIEDRRHRVGLVYNDPTHAARSKLREKLEKLSLVVVWERPLRNRSAASQLTGISMGHIEAIVMVTPGLANDVQQSVKFAAKSWDAVVFPISDRVAEWDEIRKWATRPFVIVKPSGVSRVVPVELPPEPASTTMATVPDTTELEALAESYAKDAEQARGESDRARTDLDAALKQLATCRSTIASLERDVAAARAKVAAPPDTRDADTKRAAAEAKARVAEAEVTELRREVKKLREALNESEEKREQAEDVARQARKRPATSNTDKLVGALKVIVETGSMRAEEAWDRLLESVR